MPTLISGSTGVNKIQDGTIVNADVADIAASKLTGALPALDGSALTATAPRHVTGHVTWSNATTTSTAYGSNNMLAVFSTAVAVPYKSICIAHFTSHMNLQSMSQWYMFGIGFNTQNRGEYASSDASHGYEKLGSWRPGTLSNTSEPMVSGTHTIKVKFAVSGGSMTINQPGLAYTFIEVK